MKKFYLIALSSIMFLTCPYSTNANVIVPKGVETNKLKTYENKEKHYSIIYPGDWVQKDMPKLDIVLFSPPKDPSKESQASMNVVSEKVDSSVSLDQFYSESITNLTSALKDVKIVKNGDANLDGIPYKWVIYTHTLGNLKFSVMQYFIVAKEMIYLLTFSSLADVFSEYQPSFETTAKSFKLISDHTPQKAL